MAPQVPIYDGNQVKESAMPSVKVNPGVPSTEAFGGGAEKLLSEATNMFARAKKEADEIAAQDFDNKLAEHFNADLFDDKEGALNLKGEQALFKDGKAYDLAAERGEKFEKYYKELRKNLHGADQIAAAEKYYSQRKMAHSSALEKHQASQFAEFSDNTDKAAVKIAQQDGITNYFDPAKVKSALEKQNQVIDRMAARNGMGAEQVQLMKLSASSDTHEGVITKYLGSNQDMSAEAYYKKHKKEMTPEAQTQMEQKLEAGVLLIKAQRGSDQIFEQFRGNEKGAYDEVKKKYTGKVRDAVEKQLDVQFRRYKEAKTEVNSQAFKEDWLTVWKTKDLNAIKERFGNYTHEQQKDLIAVYEKGAPGFDDPTSVNYLTNLFNNEETQDQAKQVVLTDYLSLLKPATLARFEASQAKLRQDDPEELKRLNNEFLSMSGVRPILEQAGITDDTEIFQFNESLKRNMEILKSRSNGRDLTSDEIAVEANRLLVNNKITQTRDLNWYESLALGPLLPMKLMGWKSDKFKITENNSVPLYKTTFEEIPVAIKNRLRDFIISQGESPTPQKIMYMYQYQMEKAAKEKKK